MSATLGEHLRNAEGTFEIHSTLGSVERTLRKIYNFVSVERTFEVRRGNIQGTFREHSGNIEKE
jgi:hypothetical protein